MLVPHHRVEDRQHLAHASRDRNLLLLASFHQMVILCFHDRVVADACQGRHVQRTAYIRSTSLGLAMPSFSATITVHRCYTH